MSLKSLLASAPWMCGFFLVLQLVAFSEEDYFLPKAGIAACLGWQQVNERNEPHTFSARSVPGESLFITKVSLANC